MSNEFTTKFGSGGDTLYIRAVRLKDDAAYTVVFDDDGGGDYSGDMDMDAGLGQYKCDLYRQDGASPDPDTDTDLSGGGVIAVWDGSAFNFDSAVDEALLTKPPMMKWSGLVTQRGEA